MRVCGAICQNQLELQARHFGRSPPGEIEILLLADGEVRLDRFERRNSSDSSAGRTNQISDLDLRLSGYAVDRRSKPRELKIYPRRFQRRLGRLDRCGSSLNLRVRRFHLRS